MCARVAEMAAEQAKMDAPVSPKIENHGAFSLTESSEKGAQDSTLCEVGARGDGFAPSLGMIDQMFLFAMVWGLGGGLTGDPALAFDVYIRDLVQVGFIDAQRFKGI